MSERICGYVVDNELHLGRSSVVYRARHEHDGHRAVLKVLRNTFPTAKELARHEGEWAVAGPLRLAHTVRLLALSRHGHRSVLIYEDDGCVSLSRYAAGKPMDPVALLDIAIGTARSLAELHECRVVHHDLNPANILIHPQTGGIKLTDLELARPPMVDLGPSARIAGTLAYMAPEQSGRAQARADYRSDLYSLGATLYELATGEPVFGELDDAALLHAHFALRPPGLRDRDPTFPRIIESVILKLLAKWPGERYQSAAGLLADLERLRDAAQAGEWIEIELDAFAGAASASSSDRLYGREQALDELRALLAEAESRTKPLWVALTGPAGCGKSSTVRAFADRLAQRHTLLAGRAERLTQSSPHAALKQAFTHLSRLWLSLPDAELQALREQLQQALGINLAVVATLAPGMERVTAPTPRLPPLDSRAAQARHALAIQSFLRVVCEHQAPLILFIDDIQWADPATLAFLELLLTSDLASCLVLTAQRRENAAPPRALRALFQRLAAADVRPSAIALPPLRASEVRQLLLDSFGRFAGCGAELDDVVRVVLKKTLGNPFFARQLLQKLVQSGAITRAESSSESVWQFDCALAAQLSVTDNVLSLLGERIAELPERQRRILEIGGLTGFVFEVDTVLALSSGSARCELERDLRALCEQDLLRFEREPGRVRFTHERVREASLRYLGDDVRAAYHLDIGRLWLQQPDRNLFDVVGQLNLGLAQLDDRAERSRIAKLNAEAARLARSNAAHDAALEFASTALKLAPAELLAEQPARALSLHLLLAECQAGAGQLDEAIQVFERALTFAATDLERAQILDRLSDALQSSGHPADALRQVERALALLGTEISLSPAQTAEEIAAFQEGKAVLLEVLTRADTLETIAALGDADADASLMSRLFDKAIIGVYFAHPELLGYVTARSLEHVVRTGMTPEAGLAFAWWAMILCMHDRHELAATYAQLARDSYRRFQSGYYGGAAIMVATAQTLSWTRSYEENFADAGRSVELLQASGNAQFASYGLITQHILRIVEGANLEAMIETCERWSEYCKRYVPLEVGQARIRAYCLRDLMGLSVEPLDCEAIVEQYAQQNNHTDVCESLTEMARHALFRDDFRGALAMCERAHPLFTAGAAGTLLLNFSHLVQLAIASARVARQETGSERNRLLAQHDSAAERVRALSALNPTCFAAYQHLVDADGAVACGDHDRAVAGYLGAIQHAKRHRYTLVQAQATQYLGELLGALGHDFASSLAREAEQLYRRAGMLSKVREQSDSQAASEGPGSGLRAIDLVSVFKAHDAISSEIDFECLLLRLLTLAVENAGAQRGVLALKRDDGCFIEADSLEGRLHEPLDETRRAPVRILRYVLRSGLPTVLDHGSRRELVREEPYFAQREIRSVLACPIVRQGEVRGVVYLENNDVDAAFTQERLEMIRLLTGSAAIAIENASLYRSLRSHADELEQRVRDRTAELERANAALARLAEVDGLTSVGNRRAFDRMCDRLAQQGADTGLILCDVDHFKAYNDHYGHMAGDAVLRRVATALIAHAPPGADTVTRYGGEEFAVLFEGKTLPAALALAHRMREAVAALGIPHGQSRAADHVTISLGVAIAESLDPNRIAELIEDADQALYQAKNQGRNAAVAQHVANRAPVTKGR